MFRGLLFTLLFTLSFGLNLTNVNDVNANNTNEISETSEYAKTATLIQNTENAELSKGLSEAYKYIKTPIEGSVWRSNVQNELFWFTELTLGAGKYTDTTVSMMDAKIENIFVTTGTYEIIDAQDKSIHLNDATNTKITDLKSYTKIYIMTPEATVMKSSGDTEWTGEYGDVGLYLVKIEANKIYRHSLFIAPENEYFLSDTQIFNDESAQMYELVEAVIE